MRTKENRTRYVYCREQYRSHIGRVNYQVMPRAVECNDGGRGQRLRESRRASRQIEIEGTQEVTCQRVSPHLKRQRVLLTVFHPYHRHPSVKQTRPPSRPISSIACLAAEKVERQVSIERLTCNIVLLIVLHLVAAGTRQGGC